MEDQESMGKALLVLPSTTRLSFSKIEAHKSYLALLFVIVTRVSQSRTESISQ